MTKIFNYLLQSIIIYFFFIIGRLLGIKISRILFSLIFSKVAPLFKSKLSEIKGKQLKKRVTDSLHTVERKFHI